MRPDRGDPAKAFRFELDGSIHARSKSGNARRTIEDFDLGRKWLVERRRFHIERMLEDLAEANEVFKTDPETGCRLALQVFKRVTEPGAVYSAALSECFRRSWAGACLRAEPSKQRRSR